MSEQQPFDLMAYADEEIASSGGSGSFITELKVTAGWFVFATGPNKDRFSPFHDKDGSAKAKQEIVDLIDERKLTNQKGKPARPFVAFRVAMYADSVLNRDDTPNWSEGVWEHYLVGFSESYRGVFKPSFEEYSATYEWGSKFWAEVSLTEDPDNPTWTNDDGEERTNLVPFIAQFFGSEQEARAAVDSDAVALPPQPEKWDDAYGGQWMDYAQAIYDAASEGDETSVFMDMKVGVTPAVIQTIVDLQQETEIPF